MNNYLELLTKVINEGVTKSDRTGVGTRSLFGYQLRFDLQQGFPLVTTKKLFLKGIFIELLWFLKGSTNIQYLIENNVHIWDEWADEKGELGPVYGKQWRAWQGDKTIIDQIDWVIKEIQQNPDSRRLIVSAWNVADLEKMALHPCHVLFQFYVVNNTLSCQLYQRSADIFLGLPFNIASYALLTHMIAQVTHLQVGEFIHSLGDVHLYNNHIQQAQLQLSRIPYPLPQLKLNSSIENINDFSYQDIEIINYQYHPSIKANVAV